MQSSHCCVSFGLEQDFLPGRFCCNSLLHRRGHGAKGSIPSYGLNDPPCPLKAWSDQASAEPAPGTWARALLCVRALLSSLNSNRCMHRVLPRGRSHNSWKVLVEQVESCFISDWGQSSDLPAFQALGPFTPGYIPTLAHKKATRQICSWLNHSRLRFTLIKICKMSPFHKLTQIGLFAGAPEPSPVLWAHSLGFDRSRYIRMSTPEDNRFNEDLSDTGLMKSEHTRASHNQN